MAEDQGIHPEVVRQLTDLHRKHAELQMQMHDKGDEEPHAVFQEMLAELKELNANLKELIPAVKADVKADLAEAGKGDAKTDVKESKNERRRERAGAAGAPGKATPEA